MDGSNIQIGLKHLKIQMNERYHYEEVRKAHKALKVALQNALGIEQIEKEY